MGALDDLLASWRTNPDAEATIALCSFLGAAERHDLVKEVGTNAETWHGRDGDVMIAVGRMYLDTGNLPEAQAAFVAAGKASAQDPRPFRYLGEVLLRRGDAMRSEKVLARALQLGLSDGDVRHWHDRASFYIALQKRVGAQAVADEVSRALPKRVSIPAPLVRPQPFGGDDPPTVRVDAPSLQVAPLPRFASDPSEEISQVEPLPEPPPPPPPPPPPEPKPRPRRAQTLIGVAPPTLGVAAQPPSARRIPQVVMPSAQASAAVARPSEEFDSEAVTTITVTPLEINAQPEPEPEPPTRKRSVPPPPAIVARPAAGKGVLPLGAAPPQPDPIPSPVIPFTPAKSSAPPPPPAPTGFVPMPAPVAPKPVVFDQTVDSAAPTRRYEDKNPPPGVVLEHLARVGLFEPQGGAKPAWEAAPKQKARGLWAMAIAIVLVAGGGGGGYFYAKDVKEKKIARAAQLSGEVDKLLRTGKVADLRSTDGKLSEAFELDSLSKYAARLWLQNRVLGALLLTTEPRGIDSAVYRGRTVGLADKELAFGRIAGFLVEGDVAGAAALLSRYDKDAGRDPYYQLAAGAVLERAGDLRAIERYEAARTLAPDLAATEIFLARQALLEFGKQRAMPVIDSLRRRGGDQPATRALSALAWVVDHERPEQLPAEAQLGPEDLKQLPAPLLAVPPMVEAVKAIRAGDAAAAAKAIDGAITLSDTPTLATTTGFLAIEIGDEQLARKAALRALSFAALYPRARILAARVALLGGRLDEAQKAVEELEPSSPDVAVVHAAVAYEALEPGDLDGAIAALGEHASDPALLALHAGAGLLRGTAYPNADELVAMARPAVPWGELVAADAALDTGNLELAERIVGARSSDNQRPVHALRAARLKRYQGKHDEALAASGKALAASMTPALLIERTYELVAAEKAADARNLLAKYPSVLGPLTGWLQAVVEVSAKQEAQAKARVAKLELPPDAAPLALKLIVARALVATGDKRGTPYVKALSAQAPKHPELSALQSEK